jgi:hypothetical protein
MTIPSAVKTFLFLTASASALGALIHFESTPARAAAGAAATPAPPSPSAGARPAPIHEVLAVDPAEAPAPSASSPAPAAPSRTVAAPDLVGRRLSVARRTARKLGLVVVAHDDEGLRVDGDQAPYYRVRRQATPAGASVEPGATVEVRVRGIEPPSGY